MAWMSALGSMLGSAMSGAGASALGGAASSAGAGSAASAASMPSLSAGRASMMSNALMNMASQPSQTRPAQAPTAATVVQGGQRMAPSSDFWSNFATYMSNRYSGQSQVPSISRYLMR